MSKNRIEVMKAAAKKAGQFIVGTDQLTATQKSNAKDFVTVADIKSQDLLRQELANVFPDAIILSEEDDEADRQALYADDFTGFVLDPIDGTYNFKRGMRESGISVGYIEDGEPQVGIVYDPYKDELFEAQRGQGALCNGEFIHVTDQIDLHGASVATSNGYDDAAAERNFLRHIGIYKQSGVMPWSSCPGSAVLTMVWLASGRIDAFHHNGLKPWDNAAAFLIVMEAGGIIETLDGNVSKFTDKTVLMGNPNIQSQLRTIFNDLPSELLH